MHILPTLSTLFIVISAIFMAIGIAKVKNGQVEAHRKMMMLAGTQCPDILRHLCFQDSVHRQHGLRWSGCTGAILYGISDLPYHIGDDRRHPRWRPGLPGTEGEACQAQEDSAMGIDDMVCYGNHRRDGLCPSLCPVSGRRNHIVDQSNPAGIGT